MSVSEHDLETLEVWLDGEFTEEQADALRQRLSLEPQLADAVARLRGDRQMRSRMWQALEPSDAEVESLVSQVRRGVRKEDLVTSRLRMFSRITAVAASLALVFMAGWISSSRLQIGTPDGIVVTNVRPKAANPNGVQIQPADPGMTRLVAAPRNSVNVPVSNLPPQQTIDMNRISKLAPNYEVFVIDPITREVKFQRQIERLDDATQFANYIARFQSGAPSVDQPIPSQPLDAVPVNAVQKP